MQESRSSYKIYSRNRIKIFKPKKYNRKYRKRNAKIFYVFVIIIIVIGTYFTTYKSVEPIFEEICLNEAQAVATKVTNEESTKVMNNYKYSDMFTIEKDDTR